VKAWYNCVCCNQGIWCLPFWYYCYRN